jgi:uncharacterized membrane protein YcjF (UPF0283 family)
MPNGRAHYAAYIKEQVDAQEARKNSLEQRGLAVISTSGVLVTLLFGLTALTTRRGATFVIPDTSAAFLIAALAFFVLASLSALITNLPRSYQGAKVDALRDAVRSRWEDSEVAASRKVAFTRLTVLDSAKKVNNQKGLALVAGMVCEIIAVALVGIAMGFVLWD